jgi:hypothetical protein
MTGAGSVFQSAFTDVANVDLDRAGRFFADTEGVRDIDRAFRPDTDDPAIRFVRADYREPLDLADESFDLLVSLFAGFVSEHRTRHPRLGGCRVRESEPR